MDEEEMKKFISDIHREIERDREIERLLFIKGGKKRISNFNRISGLVSNFECPKCGKMSVAKVDNMFGFWIFRCLACGHEFGGNCL